MDVLRDTIKRWVAAAEQLHDFYDKGGPTTFERFNGMLAERDAAYAEHEAVIAGDVDACAAVWARLQATS